MKPVVLSLQGCMATGKTTAVQYLQIQEPRISVSFESNRHVIEEVKRRKLDKNQYEDYLEIQKLWLKNEIARYEEAITHPVSIMDFGAEEIEFYTLNYPKSMGKNWEIASALKSELEAVRACMPARILFLDASEETLRAHKEADSTRSREFFEYYLKHLMPLKKAWVRERKDTDWFCVDGLTAEEVGEQVKKWVSQMVVF